MNQKILNILLKGDIHYNPEKTRADIELSSLTELEKML
jgi:hypothetical protein